VCTDTLKRTVGYHKVTAPDRAHAPIAAPNLLMHQVKPGAAFGYKSKCGITAS
jgi:hypothetical protein